MNYLQLLQALEHRLGYQHLPVNPRAASLKQIFETSPVHHDLMHQLVQAIYATNGCRQLTDAVDKDACFDAIGPVRQQAMKTPSMDVEAYHLIDELCHAVDEIFNAEEKSPSVNGADKKPSAEVISLNNVRRRPKRL